MKPAGVLIRGLALFFDLILFCIVFFPVTFLVKGVWLMTPGDHLWIIFDPICAVFLAIIILYYVFLEGLLGFTVGKYILGLHILTTDYTKISLQQSLIRNLLRMVDGTPLNIPGIIFIIRSPIKQRFGDRIAKTIVVRK
jgi:uncharacterized RDD family membrane protein YckC